MKVKMMTGIAGADFSVAPGHEYECSAEEAVRLIEAGYAEAVSEPKVERAVKPVPAKRGK